jgi:hypothetical protein
MACGLIIATSAAAVLLTSTAFSQQLVRRTGAVPDFSGTWAHPYLPGFEPLPSGPSPVVSKFRQRQVFDTDGRPIAPGTSAPLVFNNHQQAGDYTNSNLRPWAAEIVKRFGETESRGVASPTPTNQCWPEPVPYIFWNLGMQMLQQPHMVTIIYVADNQVRRVRMNDAHPTEVTPTWYGDSVGHYEGDTLVIDTIGVKSDRPFAMIDMFGTPYTQVLHVIERYRLLDHEATKEALRRAETENFRLPASNDSGLVIDTDYRGMGLQLEFTVEDENAFTTPWSATITYRRTLATGWPEFICAENLHATYMTKDTPVPRADKPDF